MYSFKALSSGELTGFAGLTFRHLQGLLLEAGVSQGVVATGAYMLGSPIGLALAEQKDNTQTAILRSIAVARQCRQSGVATALLETLEVELLLRGFNAAEVLLLGDRPPQAALARLLKKRGWPAFQPSGIFCQTDYATVARAPWMKHKRLPSQFQVFDWRDLEPLDRIDIQKRQQEAAWFPQVLTPFDHEERLEPLTSFGLKHDGRVIGWCIFHRINSHTTACTSLVVHKEYQDRGYAIALLVRGIDAHREMPGHKFVFDVAYGKTQMMKFIKRHLAPYLTSVRVVNTTMKRFDHSLGLRTSA